ncbi:hypothetical protein [Roseibium sp.]|uniref:hypothetical protein n=1 Tax=Roseibium sp. TaxID=1936156 RepID=UPI003A97E940
MKKLMIAAFVTALATPALAGLPPLWAFGTEDVSAGVLCKVKDVTVLAQSADDCAKIGGAATHTVTMDKEPVK